MSKEAEYRAERINRLLFELKYEISRGMMEGEIDEDMGYRFVVPVSKKIPDGVVLCEFRSRPMPNWYIADGDREPRLKVVK